MRYRRLDKAELQELEREFVRFLAANGIPADEWERLKTQQSSRVDALIEQFSDLVFEKVLAEVVYLEHKTPQMLRTFHIEDTRIVLNGLLVEGATTLDLSQDLTPTQMMEQLRATGAQLKFFTAERPLRKDRQREIFELMEEGALISREGSLFVALEALKTDPRQSSS